MEAIREIDFVIHNDRGQASILLDEFFGAILLKLQKQEPNSTYPRSIYDVAEDIDQIEFKGNSLDGYNQTHLYSKIDELIETLRFRDKIPWLRFLEILQTRRPRHYEAFKAISPFSGKLLISIMMCSSNGSNHVYLSGELQAFFEEKLLECEKQGFSGVIACDLNFEPGDIFWLCGRV
jgi:hypothetical protein